MLKKLSLILITQLDLLHTMTKHVGGYTTFIFTKTHFPHFAFLSLFLGIQFLSGKMKNNSHRRLEIYDINWTKAEAYYE